MREFLPGMLAQKKGHIVTIASMASFVAAPGLLDYGCSKVGALFVSEGRSSLRKSGFVGIYLQLPLGIRAECLTRYAGGEGICTTSVHPSWHATGIIKGMENALEKHGIRPDPPSNVSDQVVEQVLRARSGRLIIPGSEESKTRVRHWPRWTQDLMFGFAGKRKENQLRLRQRDDLALDPKLF